MTEMKFDLFKVAEQSGQHPSMQESIRQIAGMSEKPVKHKGARCIVLHKHERVHEHDAELVDIVEARSEDFPGVYTSDGENKDLPIEEGDKISQQTMALHVNFKGKPYLVCQYNHYGAKAGRIADYFAHIHAGCKYTLLPVINEDAVKEFMEAPIVSAFHVGIDASELSAGQLAGAGLQNIVRKAKSHNAGVIEVIFKHGKLEGTQDLANELLSIPDGINKLEARVKPQFDARMEALDLLEQRVCYKIGHDMLSKTEGKRYDYESRKRAIVDAITELREYMRT